jgi:long-subunit acyl-CoA synthetase (AMP-forming)
MNELLVRLADRAATSPDAVSVEGVDGKLTALGLLSAVHTFTKYLEAAGIERIGLLAQNSPGWITADIACQSADICLIPLPHFFSDTQLLNSIERAGIDALLTDDPTRLDQIIPNYELPFDCGQAYGLTLRAITEPLSQALPGGTAKITFTSGSTGAPRGVCLGNTQQLRVAQALAAATQNTSPRHLCLLPLSTLLENIGGVYFPLLTDGTVTAPPGADVGLSGSAGLDIPKMLQALERHQPTSIILLPQMLVALVAAANDGWIPTPSLEFVAVGGGKVSASLVRMARSSGLPVYEGYGLSETASVACLNLPDRDVPGSVGQTLGHVDVQIENGEVIIRGNNFLGYLDDPASWYPESVATGDLGHLDEKGFLYISGRKKNILISSFGRNISPEWVESQLLGGPLLSQCIVFGDTKPWCVALLAPANPECPDQDIQAWIDRANADLPDYARVLAWERLQKPLSTRDGFLTDNGRPRRARIESQYHSAIESLYSESKRISSL